MAQPIIKRQHVHLEDRQKSKAAPQVILVQNVEPAPEQGQKSVRLLEEAGRVHALEFTCSCGDVTAVELVYPGNE